MRIKKEIIREVVRNFLFEAPSGSSLANNLNYGIYDRPGPSWDEEKLEDTEKTVHPEVPLVLSLIHI